MKYFSMPQAKNMNCYVFVVCGKESCIHELNKSLTALKRRTKAEILVITDSRRNRTDIVWSNVVDVRTPSRLNHHQASIYLKTQIHRLVAPGKRYCYLDSDIFATADDVDAIFTCSKAPIAFAADLCKLHQFSPYAVCCGCMEKNEEERNILNEVLADAYGTVCLSPNELMGGWQSSDYEKNARNRKLRLKTYLKYLFSQDVKSLRGYSHKQRWQAYWYESHERALYVPDRVVDYIEQKTEWRRHRSRQSWISPKGNDVFHLTCNHLVESIQSMFGIRVADPYWQHWNGGVFIFDHRADRFLNSWHEKTLKVFDHPGWETRDQGTLIATTWEHGLQNQRTIPKKFNCILDCTTGSTMVLDHHRELTTDAWLTKIEPSFCHVFQSENDAWEVWQWVRRKALD